MIIKKSIQKLSGPLRFSVRFKSASVPETSTKYCIDLVRKFDHENFLCTLLLPPDVRIDAFAIRAFNIEVAKVADQAKEKHIALMRMKFWEDTIDGIYAGKPPNHPVAMELARVVSKKNLMKRQLKRLIIARSNLLNLNFESILSMEKYCEETVSPVYYLILEAAGIKNVEADHAASHLGKSQGLVNLIRSVPQHAAAKTITLPSDLLAKHGVSQEQIIRGYTSPELVDVIFSVASSAKIHLDKARSLNRNLPKECSNIFLPAVAVGLYLNRLQHFGFDVFNEALFKSSSKLGYKLFFNKILRRY